MNEDFLQFVWQHQLFESPLHISSGQELEVLNSGILNTHSGPDFEMARIKIEEMAWVGQVEVHYKPNQWFAHKHHLDPAYNNVILHVVWEDDGQGPEGIPVLALQTRVPEDLILRWQKLRESLNPIACHQQIHSVPTLKINDQKDKALIDRLEQKSARVFQIFQNTGKNWDETVYIFLAEGMGFHLNKIPFERTATSLPMLTLLKHRNTILQLEALLVGQSGLLQAYRYDHPYLEKLKREYEFLKHKHSLQSMDGLMQWKFGSVRPPFFPTIKLAQLAKLIHLYGNLFHLVRDTEEIDQWYTILQVKPSDFWLGHYSPHGEVKKPAGAMGRKGAENLMINTLSPLLAAYARHTGEEIYMERALRFLEQLPAESNRITREWDLLGIESSSAFDSQAVIQLYKHFCTPRKCLQCSIGHHLMKRQE